MNNLNLIFESSIDDDLQDKPFKPLKVAAQPKATTAPHPQGSLIDPLKVKPEASRMAPPPTILQSKPVDSVKAPNLPQPSIREELGYSKTTQPKDNYHGHPHIPIKWNNQLPTRLGSCGHYHTVIGQETCNMFNHPLEYCKFHDDKRSCRYYCRRLNEASN